MRQMGGITYPPLGLVTVVLIVTIVSQEFNVVRDNDVRHNNNLL